MAKPSFLAEDEQQEEKIDKVHETQTPLPFLEQLGLSKNDIEVIRKRVSIQSPKQKSDTFKKRRAQGKPLERRPAFCYPLYDKNESHKARAILQNSDDLKELFKAVGIDKVIEFSAETHNNNFNPHDTPISWIDSSEVDETDIDSREDRELHRKFLKGFTQKYHKTKLDMLKACYELGHTSAETSEKTGIPRQEVKAFWKAFAQRFGWQRGRLAELLEKKLMLRNLSRHVVETEQKAKLTPTEWTLLEETYHRRVCLLDNALDLMESVIQKGKELAEQGIDTPAQLRDFSIVVKNLAEAILKKETQFELVVNTNTGDVVPMTPQVIVTYDKGGKLLEDHIDDMSEDVRRELIRQVYANEEEEKEQLRLAAERGEKKEEQRYREQLREERKGFTFEHSV
jgi:hypothetical protein